MDDMAELHMDALEEALGTKIKDREAFMSAFRGLVSCCGDGEESEEESEGDEGSAPGPKKGPSIALILGKPKEK
jgi:hypothetical protein